MKRCFLFFNWNDVFKQCISNIHPSIWITHLMFHIFQTREEASKIINAESSLGCTALYCVSKYLLYDWKSYCNSNISLWYDLYFNTKHLLLFFLIYRPLLRMHTIAFVSFWRRMQLLMVKQLNVAMARTYRTHQRKWFQMKW